MTLCWTDGNTTLPVNGCLLSSTNENVLGPETETDKRSLAGKRRALSKMKGTKAMIELIKIALANGHKADYVLFDTWFSSPAQLIDIKSLGLDAIAMVKKSSKIRYLYDGKKLSISKIFVESYFREMDNEEFSSFGIKNCEVRRYDFSL